MTKNLNLARRFFLISPALLVAACENSPLNPNTGDAAELLTPATLFVRITEMKGSVVKARLEIAYSGQNPRNYEVKSGEDWIKFFDQQSRCNSQRVCLRTELFDVDYTREEFNEALSNGLVVEARLGSQNTAASRAPNTNSRAAPARIDRLRFSARDLRFSVQKYRADQEVRDMLSRNRR